MQLAFPAWDSRERMTGVSRIFITQRILWQTSVAQRRVLQNFDISPSSWEYIIAWKIPKNLRVMSIPDRISTKKPFYGNCGSYMGSAFSTPPRGRNWHPSALPNIRLGSPLAEYGRLRCHMDGRLALRALLVLAFYVRHKGWNVVP